MSLSLERSCGGCSGLHGEMAGDIKRIGVWAGISKGGRDGGSVDLSKSHTVDRVDLLRASCPGRLSSEHQNGAPTHSPRRSPCIPDSVSPDALSPLQATLTGPTALGHSCQIRLFLSNHQVQPPPLPCTGLSHPPSSPPSEGWDLPAARPHLRPSNGIAIMPNSAVACPLHFRVGASQKFKTLSAARSNPSVELLYGKDSLSPAEYNAVLPLSQAIQVFVRVVCSRHNDGVCLYECHDAQSVFPDLVRNATPDASSPAWYGKSGHLNQVGGAWPPYPQVLYIRRILCVYRRAAYSIGHWATLIGQLPAIPAVN